MATINDQGNIIAHCPQCEGAKSTFEYRTDRSEFGHILRIYKGEGYNADVRIQFRLFRCAGCGRGGLGVIKMMDVHGSYPKDVWELLSFYPDARPRLSLPKDVPDGIVAEFREAEACLDAGCYRAAAALFRSVLDKTLGANGYRTEDARNLKKQIDAATSDGVITQARQRKAHEELRVLGNDVLHDEWRKLTLEDVELAHHYAQRILEDFYDDRQSVLEQLKKAGRTFDKENKTQDKTPKKEK